MERLCRDLKRLCEWHIDLFGRPAPMDRYVFLVTAIGEGHGGLEHRASTALLCSRDDLPQAHAKESTEEYRTFLGLCSHEYFHTWNVKRIKPATFIPYDLSRENYTTLLWAFEGITSYYDDLALVRSGLVTQAQYLETLGRSITSLLRTPGRLRQNVAEASWDAWIKYYRQDENAPNALVSYYLKGSLIALCLDLLIRSRTRGRKSLDHVLRELWSRHGRSGVGVLEDGIERTAEEATGLRLRPFFNRALRSTAELPLGEMLAWVGIAMDIRPAESAGDRGGKKSPKPARELAKRVVLGARTADDVLGVKLTHVYDSGAAQATGLSAGDVIVALDGLRLTAKNLDKRLASRAPGDAVQVHAFRRDELLVRSLTLLAPAADTCALDAGGNASERRRRAAWLAS
jgi:predicted metalloprotease with PDZ domain